MTEETIMLCSLVFSSKSWSTETSLPPSPQIDVTYVTIVLELRHYQNLIFWLRERGPKTIGKGLSQFRRCYMTRITAQAGAPARVSYARITLHLSWFTFRRFFLPEISTFNDRERGSRL